MASALQPGRRAYRRRGVRQRRALASQVGALTIFIAIYHRKQAHSRQGAGYLGRRLVVFVPSTAPYAYCTGEQLAKQAAGHGNG